jgi:hypothetical protein
MPLHNKSGHFLQVKQTAAVLITYPIVLFQHINGSPRDLAEQLVAVIKMAIIQPRLLLRILTNYLEAEAKFVSFCY